MPLRIAWVIPGPLDQMTGGYIYDRRMVEGLRARGHDVMVLRVPTRVPYLDPLAGLSLARSLRAGRFSTIIIDELAHPAMWWGLRLGKRSQEPTQPACLTLVHHLRASETDGWRRHVARLAERQALRVANGIVCTSHTTATVVRELIGPGTPISVVTPGVHAAPERDGAHDGGEPSRPGRLICVAHLTPRKGIVSLLHALARAAPAAELDLVGDATRDPTHAAYIRALLRELNLGTRVRIRGTVSDAELQQLLITADAFVLASTYEGYGMAIADAVAAGLPVIATRTGAIPEVVRDGLEAELVPPNDVTALTTAIDRLVSDRAERDRRAGHARERARSLPTWEQACAAFVEIVEDAG
ncbi:MAG: glycosyltransferase family 4 protein [Chloroflexota bacterium]